MSLTEMLTLLFKDGAAIIKPVIARDVFRTCNSSI